MEDSYLESSRKKLRWADQRLDELESEASQYQQALGQEIHLRMGYERVGGSLWSVTRALDYPEPDEALGLIAADAMQNSRAALDHLACALVATESGPDAVTKRTAFPIYERRPTRKKDIDHFTSAVKGMRSEHVEAIKKLQPYSIPHTPEARNLIRLAVLNNREKHRVSIDASVVVDAELDEPALIEKRPKGVLAEVNRGLLKRGDWTVRIHEPDPAQPIIAQIPYSLNIRFGHRDIGISELRQVRAHVVGIVESFGPAFES